MESDPGSKPPAGTSPATRPKRKTSKRKATPAPVAPAPTVVASKPARATGRVLRFIMSVLAGMALGWLLSRMSDHPPQAVSDASRSRVSAVPTAARSVSSLSAPVRAHPIVMHHVGETFRDCDDDACPWIMVIGTGIFHMGSREDESGREADESPSHDVDIDYVFGVGVYPVTRGQWRAASDHNTSGSRCVLQPVHENDSYPAVCIGWQDASRYVKWLTVKTGYHYRLLSEAEYEYIDRGGRLSTYFWGDTQDGQCNYANGADAAGKAVFAAAWAMAAECNDRYVYTSPVASFKPNFYGLYDTTGNVWSWTEDCYHSSYDGAPLDGSAWIVGDCTRRMIRGGAWNSFPADLRSAKRAWRSTSQVADNSLGVRIARTFEPGEVP